MPYHNMGYHTEGPRDELVMAELSVHREQPLYQEPFYQNYPAAPNHYQEQMYNVREQQQHVGVQHHSQHHHVIQQQEQQSVQHQPQPAGPPQGIGEDLIKYIFPQTKYQLQ